MNLLYKTLFEIKLMHEYFLTREDGSNLFAEPDPQKRHLLLEQAYAEDRAAIDQDISFDFPEALQDRYQQLGLKILPAYSGCKIAIRVNKKLLPDKSVVFEPFFSLPADTEIYIVIISKNNLTNGYSNERIARSMPALYFFSNENIPGARQFPFLVNTIAAFDAGFSYEQGEMAIDSSNKLQEYYYDTTGALQSVEIKTSVQEFANENDRSLLPLQFYYSVISANPVTQLDIVLKDNLGNQLKAFSFAQPDPIGKVLLDFSDIKEQLLLAGTVPVTKAVCSLQANGNNGYAALKNIFFSDTCYSLQNWGVVCIKPQPTNLQYQLIESDGYLVQRTDGLGNITEAPVFELPVKSRFGHFRYSNSNGKSLALNPLLNNYLHPENKALVSYLPMPLCKYYFLVPDNTGGSPKYLPNPKSFEIKKDAFQRIYFDITVPESDLFPVLP